MDEILLSMKKAGRAAFRTREYAALKSSGAYARLVLSRLKKRGGIEPVKNGWWAFPDSMPEAVACEVSRPCYLSFHSALYLHGLTTQIPGKIQLAVARKPRKYSVAGTPVAEYKVLAKNFSGFSRKDGILLAWPEKAFADCLSLPRTCPPVVLREAIGKIDAAKVRVLLSAAAKARLKRVISYAGQERA